MASRVLACLVRFGTGHSTVVLGSGCLVGVNAGISAFSGSFETLVLTNDVFLECTVL
jgi:uncharacterized oligopeptide transporter (OPT) family protein